MSEVRSQKSVEEQSAEARRKLGDAEALMNTAMAACKSVISAQEEEIRKLRVEALRHSDEALTEAQVAEVMQCSEQTIARLRKAGKVEPSFYVADSMPRYWRSKLAEIFEGCRPRARRVSGVGGRGSGKTKVIRDSRFQERPAA